MIPARSGLSVSMSSSDKVSVKVGQKSFIFYDFHNPSSNTTPCAAVGCTNPVHEKGGFYWCYMHRGEYNALVYGRDSKAERGRKLQLANATMKQVMPQLLAKAKVLSRQKNEKALEVTSLLS